MPILILTPGVGPQEACAVYAAGADDYVRKPFHPAELLAPVRIQLLARLLAVAALGPPSQLGTSGSFVRALLQASPAFVRLLYPLARSDEPHHTPLAYRPTRGCGLAEQRPRSLIAIGSIYQKLRVTGRRDAVVRAAQLGILAADSTMDGGG